MKGRKIEEIGVSSRGMYMRNIAGIKWGMHWRYTRVSRNSARRLEKEEVEQ